MATIETLRITDLRDPVMTEVQRDALADAEQTSFDLSVDGVLSAAAERAGLERLRSRRLSASGSSCWSGWWPGRGTRSWLSSRRSGAW